MVSGLLRQWVDTVVIVVIVVLNAAIGFTQARRADQAIAALRQLAAAQAQVLRGGQPQPVPAADLVPGDIVLLEAGNQIPADLRLLEAAQLKVDESTLTGESVTVEKRTEALVGDKLALGDRINLGFKGTTVTHGRARRGGGHRHGHRAGQGGRPAERRHGPRHAAAIAAGALFKAVVADRAADLRGVVRLWPRACHRIMRMLRYQEHESQIRPTDSQWAQIKDLLPGRAGHVGAPAKDNRLFVDAVLYRYRVGIPWRDLPERFGDFRVVHLRHMRWSRSGVWQRVFQALASQADNEYAMIDATIVRAHQHSSGGKGGLPRKPSDAAEGA